MPTSNQPARRKRGVILTLSGLQRLQAVRSHSEVQENYGKPYTLDELSQITHLSPNTLTKIHNRKVSVDKHSLESYFQAFNLSLDKNDYAKVIPDSSENLHKVTLKGQVPIDSPFYVQRQPIEQNCYEAVLQPGALLRIKAPKQMGKTSLMARILNQTRVHGFKTVTFSFQLADVNVLSDLNRFLKWFCAVVTRGLGIPYQLEEYWDDIFGSNYNCTDYFENYLLKSIDSPLVLALDEVDVVFNYPEIASDFFSLLRTWYEKAKYGDESSYVWQKLRLLVVHSTEVYIPLSINQSPFNVGFSVELPCFNPKQVEHLAKVHQLDLGLQEIEQLMALIGGNPYLVQVALEHISSGDVSLDRLLDTAATENGIYSDFLRRQFWNIKHYPDLINAFTKVVISDNPVELEPVVLFKLQSMGLVRLQNQGAIPSCDLYRQYFRESLRRLQPNVIQESRQATIVVTDVENYDYYIQSDPEWTQNELYHDFQLMIQLSEQFDGQVLKSVEDGLLIYFPSPINAVNFSQEILLTLKQSSEFKQKSPLNHRIGIHLGDVIFNCTDILGTGVKVAESLPIAAPSGGICISQPVYDAVKNSLSIQLRDLQKLQLEGVTEPISLYKINF